MSGSRDTFITKYAVSGGIQFSDGSPVIQETAAEHVECKCTMPVSAGRCSYIARWRNNSFEGRSPESNCPLRPILDIRAGSRLPSEEFVGVISQSSSMRTLRLPLLPAVNPRLKRDSPVLTMHSRIFDSFIAISSKP